MIILTDPFLPLPDLISRSERLSKVTFVCMDDIPVKFFEEDNGPSGIARSIYLKRFPRLQRG